MIEFSFDNLSDCVFHHAAERPQAPALHHGRETVSYAALAQLVTQATVYLSGQGIKAQDRVGIVLTNSIERVVLALALMRMGAVGIELPMETNPGTLTLLVNRFAMAATLVEAGGPASPAKISLTIHVHWRDELAALHGDVRYEGDPAALRLINLSSGSTGLPKGLVCQHAQRMVRSRMTLNTGDFYAHAQPGPLVLAAPASTNLVWGMLVNHLILGGPVVLLPAFGHMVELVRHVAAWEDAIFPVPPGMAVRMLDYSAGEGLLFPRMRALITAGQAIARHDKQSLIEKLTPNVYEFYGSGGLGMLTCIGPEEVKAQPKSVGRPANYPGVEVEIAGPDGQRLAAGGVGQLRVRGPNVALGFFNPEDNARGSERFVDGWYYPGEVAAMNAAGYLCLEGRIAEAITVGAGTVYPPEIEDVVSQHPHVAEVAIVGRPGTDGVEDIVAFVVGRSGFQHQAIVEHCHKKLPATKRPKYIYYLGNMPRTGNGKIDRMALKTAPLKRIDPI